MAEPILRVEGLRVQFTDTERVRTAVEGSDFEVSPGEVLGLVGESGCGKTVTCAAAMGLLNGWPGIVEGKIWFNGGDGPVNLLDGLDRTLIAEPGKPVQKKKRAWKFHVKRTFMPLWGSGMTMIFQNPQSALNPFWKVSQIVGEAVRLRERSLSREQIQRTGIEWLERVKLANPPRVWESYPHELSGGMAQRVMIAAALARGAKLLFADEPTTGLDTTVKARIVELFSALRHEEKLALVVISHDLGVVASLSDRVVVMRHGKILETRTIREVTGRAADLHPYTVELISAVDVWKTEEEALPLTKLASAAVEIPADEGNETSTEAASAPAGVPGGDEATDADVPGKQVSDAS